jgi:hypothetical protein
MVTPNAQDFAKVLIRGAPDNAWLRELTDVLDRQVRMSPLERFVTLWGLSGAEAARAFGVSRQAFAKWQENGVPAEREVALADLGTATEVLARRVKRERIPAVIRRRAELLGGKSLYEMACEGRHQDVLDAVRRMFDLRRVQP